MIEKVLISKEKKIKSFGEGEWCDEPDYVEFEHDGIACEILRIAVFDGLNGENIFGGHLCGYCKIPEKHPLYGNTDYIDKFEEFDVHGGITFNEIQKETHWVGFDCAHFLDIVPSMQKTFKEIQNKKIANLFPRPKGLESTYKNIDFVMAEIKNLATQINKG